MTSGRQVGGWVQAKEFVVSPSCSTGHSRGGGLRNASWIWGLLPISSGSRGLAALLKT